MKCPRFRRVLKGAAILAAGVPIILYYSVKHVFFGPKRDENVIER